MSDTTTNLLYLADLELEKSANIFHQIGAGLRGARQGAQQVAHSQGLHGAMRTLDRFGARPVNVVNGLVQMPAPIQKAPSFLGAVKERVQGAVGGAKQQFQATRAADHAVKDFGRLRQQHQELQNATNIVGQHGLLHGNNPMAVMPDYSKMSPAQYLRQQGHVVPAHHRTAPPPLPPQAPQQRRAVPHGPLSPTPPQPIQARPQGAPRGQPLPQGRQIAQNPPVAPTGHPQQGAQAPTDPNGQVATPHWMNSYAGPLALGAGAAALGTSALRGGPTATEQDIRMRDYMANAQQNMATPLPPMSVYASYDHFAAEKAAAYTPMYPTMQGAMANSLAQQLAQKFVGEPIDAVHRVLKKKLYDEPKHEAAYMAALEGDDILQAEHNENPERLRGSFHTLKTFAPTIAKNPLATRTFLRQSTMSGMNGSGPDFATIRMMAETEKFIQNAKGRGIP